MRIVFDTNVLISAFLWQKGLRKIYQIIRLGEITPCFTQLTWAELVRVLSYNKFKKQLLKIGITPEEIIELISNRSYFTISHFQISEIKEDPSDNHILSCAVATGASFIITGDKHLLNIKEFRKIKILTPKKFLKICGKIKE